MNPVSRKATLALGLVLASCIIPAASFAAEESPLGSPAASAALYTSDYAVAVRAALPPIDAATLARLLDEVARAAAEERPLAVGSVADLERFFGLRASGQESPGGYRLIDSGEAAYRVDSTRQHFFLALNNDGARPQPREVATRNLPDIRAAHADLAARLGIPSQEIFYADFREVLSQAKASPLEGGGVEPVAAEAALTTLLRAVAGVQVEGSFLRIASIDPKRLDLVDARWPLVRLSPLVGRVGVRSPADAGDAVRAKVAADSGGQPVALHMAVVLRPVDEREAEFVPSLKVGIQPQAIPDGEDGFRTDAGEVFYVDLLRDSGPLADPPAKPDTDGSDR